MTVIGTKREFHGALSRHSPYRIAPMKCLGPCQKTYVSSCEILDNLCHRCFKAGWRLDPLTNQIRRRLEVVGRL